MKIAHGISITVYSHEKDAEDLVLIEKKFRELIDIDFEKEKIVLEKEVAKGINEQKIHMYGAQLTKQRHTTLFLNSLCKHLSSSEKKKILSQLESRLDDHLNFFLRFDKKEYLNSSSLLLTDSGSCFHVKIIIAAFPKKRETALAVLKNFFTAE